MTCRELVTAMGDFIAGELTAEVEAAFESHLGVCEACRKYLAGYRATIAAVKSAHAGDEPSPERVRKVVDMVLATTGAARDAKH
jgi:anti-sigma factor RsiW